MGECTSILMTMEWVPGFRRSRLYFKMVDDEVLLYHAAIVDITLNLALLVVYAKPVFPMVGLSDTPGSVRRSLICLFTGASTY